MLIDVIKVFRSGNSLVLRIPPEAIKVLNLKPGDKMACYVDGERLIYEPLKEEG